MLLPTHIAGAYLTSEACVYFAFRSKRVPRSDLRGPLFFGIIAGILPDLDLLPAVLQAGSAVIGDQAGAHRATVLHTLVFAGAVGLLPFTLPLRHRVVWAAAGWIGVTTHLILDSLTIGWGVMWLYPFSSEFYGINVATRWYRAAWGDQWLANYLAHPLFLTEATIIIVAIAVVWRKSLVTPR